MEDKTLDQILKEWEEFLEPAPVTEEDKKAIVARLKEEGKLKTGNQIKKRVKNG